MVSSRSVSAWRGLLFSVFVFRSMTRGGDLPSLLLSPFKPVFLVEGDELTGPWRFCNRWGLELIDIFGLLTNEPVQLKALPNFLGCSPKELALLSVCGVAGTRRRKRNERREGETLIDVLVLSVSWCVPSKVSSCTLRYFVTSFSFFTLVFFFFFLVNRKKTLGLLPDYSVHKETHATRSLRTYPHNPHYFHFSHVYFIRTCKY